MSNIEISSTHDHKANSWPKWPVFDRNAIVKDIERVLDSGRWAISGQWTGAESETQKFERKFADYNQIEYCALTDHGTTALTSALIALDIGPGDEVIVPALTWPATAIAVLQVNAVPIIVDVSPDDYCISIDKVKAAITPRTKACIPVHLYGSTCDMERLMELSNEYGFFVIEDCAHSHGTVYQGRRVGTIGHIGIFSFQQGKILTSGEGGAVVTSHQSIYEKLCNIRFNSRTLKKDEPIIGEMELVEDDNIMGTNYCITEFQAAILSSQLDHLDEQNEKRSSNANYLNSLLEGIEGVSTIPKSKGVSTQSFYRYCFKIDRAFFGSRSTTEICESLKNRLGIVFEQPYSPLSSSKIYKPTTIKKHRLSKEYIEQISPIESKTPIAIKASSDEAIVFHHSVLLADRNNMELIAEAIRLEQNRYKEMV